MATVTVRQREQVMCHLIVIMVSWGWSHSRPWQMGSKHPEPEITSLLCCLLCTTPRPQEYIFDRVF